MSSYNLSKIQLGKHVQDEVVLEPNGSHAGKLSIYSPSFTEGSQPVAYLDYVTHKDSPNVEIEYIKSHKEGLGHASTLLHHLYQKFPGQVSWGTVTHAASKHLFDKFSQQYGRSDYDKLDYKK